MRWSLGGHSRNQIADREAASGDIISGACEGVGPGLLEAVAGVQVESGSGCGESGSGARMRVATTLLEQFRLWSTQGDNEWMPESELLAAIRHEPEKPKDAVLLGQAFHKVLEKPYESWEPVMNGYSTKVHDGETWRTFFFAADVMVPALDRIDKRAVPEVKTTREYGPVTVVAKADVLLGTGIIEYKTKTTAFDFDRYWESLQWRFYLDVFGASSVTYHVFLLGEGKDGIELRDIVDFRLYPYPTLHKDCVDAVRRFIDYVDQRGLREFLTDRPRQSGAPQEQEGVVATSAAGDSERRASLSEGPT